VVRGSNSAAYGSNAFLGIVNIITDDASRQPGTRLKLAAGQPGIRDASLRHASQSGPLSLRVSAHHEQDDGFADLHDGRRTDVLNLRADLRLDGHDEVVLNAGIAESTHELGYAGSIFDIAAQREGRDTNRSLHLRWRHGPEDDAIRVSAYWSRQSRDDLWRYDSAANSRSPGERLPRTPARHGRQQRHLRPAQPGARAARAPRRGHAPDVGRGMEAHRARLALLVSRAPQPRA
jgi:iron complex outermembrane receptor protein